MLEPTWQTELYYVEGERLTDSDIENMYLLLVNGVKENEPDMVSAEVF